MSPVQELVFKRPRVFFFHYNKPASAAAGGEPRMSVHIAGACHIVRHVECQTPIHTKENKIQPRVVMRGLARRVTIENDRVTLFS